MTPTTILACFLTAIVTLIIICVIRAGLDIRHNRKMNRLTITAQDIKRACKGMPKKGIK